MTTPLLNRVTKYCIIFTLCIILFCFCFTLTLFTFLIHHFVTIKTQYQTSLTFHQSLSTSIPSIILFSNHSFPPNHFQNFQHISAILTLILPESNINYENSIFDISTNLFCQSSINPSISSKSCISDVIQHVSLKFRSPIHRAIRVFVLSPLYILGIKKEYQTIQIHLIQHLLQSHLKPSSIHINILNPHLQIANSKLRINMTKQSLLKRLFNTSTITFILVISTTIWYVSIVACGMAIAVSATTAKIITTLLTQLNVVDKETTTRTNQELRETEGSGVHTEISQVKIGRKDYLHRVSNGNEKISDVYSVKEDGNVGVVVKKEESKIITSSTDRLEIIEENSSWTSEKDNNTSVSRRRYKTKM